VTRATPTDRGFMGHPRGLFYLAFTEGWERFSYYGMTGLLALYLVNQLLLPGHVEQVLGFPAWRAALEAIFGPLSTQALAAQTFGLYAGFVYFTPLLGGAIADRWIGQRAAVVIGALAMSAGHLAMTFDESFLVALLLLVIGSGFLKGNITAQVGSLYPLEDEARRSHGFIIFSTAINIGSVLGPLLAGLLAQRYGWHWGFGIAAIFMLAGLVTYLIGYRHLPARVERERRAREPLTAADRRRILALAAVMAVTVFHSVAYFQLFNVNPIWIQRQVAPTVLGFEVPIPWYQASNSLFAILGVPLVFGLWRRQARRGGEPGDLAKIGVGAWLSVVSNLLLVAGILLAGSSLVHPVWPVLYSFVLGISFLYYWPTLLALVSRAAPAKVNATLMGFSFMTLFVANVLIGWIGGFYERMSAVEFWLLHAAIGAGGGITLAFFGRRLARALES
ncbi:MAG: peptide MFS transporter, partial [Gemmatimonadales bacterium]